MKQLTRRFLLPLTTGAMVLYVAVGGLIYAGQKDLIFHPDILGREPVVTPGNRGWDFEDVWLQPQAGERMHGWFIPHPNARGVVLLCHGNAGNIGHRLDFVTMLRELGLTVLLFDYRGFGRSDGEPSEKGMYRDAETALAYLTGERDYAADEVIVLGRSLGGAVASHISRNTPVRALILESSFTSIVDMAAEMYPVYPVRWMSRYRFDTLAHVQGTRSPVLILHSRDDELVPFGHARRLFESAAGPKRLVVLRGSHNDAYTVSADTYKRGLEAFLADY